MSKIVLVSKKLNNSTWMLAKGLRSQSNEVIILTSRNEVPPEDDTAQIELMTYFKEWSFGEAVKLLPTLIGSDISIMHLLMEEQRVHGAYVVLSTFAKKNPRCILSISFFNSVKRISRKSPLKFLVERSDIVTLPTPDAMSSLRGLRMTNKYQGRLVLSPVLPSLPLRHEISFSEIVSDIAFETSSTRNTKPKALIYFNQSEFNPDSKFYRSLQLLSEKYHLIFWGTNSQWPLRERKKFATWISGFSQKWQFLHVHSIEEDIKYLSSHDMIFLSFTDMSLLKLAETMALGLGSKASLILDNSQTGVYAGLWRNGKNCWILQDSKNLDDLESLLNQKTDLPYPKPQDLGNNQQLIDSSLNELNRLYNKALLQLR